MKKRRRLSEDDQIDIPPEPAGQVRLNPQSFAAGDCPFRDDRQVEITAPTVPAGRRGSEQIDGRNPLLSPEYGGQVLHFSVLFIIRVTGVSLKTDPLQTVLKLISSKPFKN